jgi:two-component system LytT family sensor kinase
MALSENTKLPLRPYLVFFLPLAILLPAFLDGLQQYVRGRVYGGLQWRQVGFHAGEWLLFGALTPIVYVLGRRFPLSPVRWGRTVVVHLAGSLLLCTGGASLGIALGTVLRTSPAIGPVRESLPRWFLISLPYAVSMYFAELVCIYAVAYFVESRNREAQASRLSTQLAEARLDALRAQLNPHFLFNSLNALAVLVREKRTADASRMLELLSDVLHRVLRSNEGHVVSLGAELAFLRQYLSIEEVRFSDRLRVEWFIEPRSEAVQVPTLILQPLLENAIQHGIARRADSGLIRISTLIIGHRLRISIEDDGLGMENAQLASEGVGLSNTRERLAALFGDAAALSIDSELGRGTRVLIELPFSGERS